MNFERLREWEIGPVTIEPLVLILLVTFVALAYVANTHGEAGLFPLLFLVVGALFMGIHLTAVNLPGDSGEKARELLKTKVATVDSVDDPDTDDAEGGLSYRNIGIVTATLAIFCVIFYFGNFIVATVVYILLTGYLLGLRNYYVLALLTMIITALVYFVFGGVMNTPILE